MPCIASFLSISDPTASPRLFNPIASYTMGTDPTALGGNARGDVTQFRDTFQPTPSMFQPNYPLVPTDRERVRAWAYPTVKTEAAKERLDRLARGKPVASGFDKPMTLEDVIKATGWTASDLRRVRLTHAISEAGGFEMLMAEIHRRHERAENSAGRAVAAKLGISTKR